MTNTIERKLRNLSNKANHHQHKLSALILYKGRPISFGFNDKDKTHPKILPYSTVKTVHAEMAAIFKTKNKEMLKDCTMIVFRQDRMGNMALARPCAVCQEMLKDYGITNIIYTTPTGWVEENF